MQVLRPQVFTRWLNKLRDQAGLIRINKRLDQVELTGYLGVTRSLGKGIHEMKMDYGPGYRMYYAIRGTTIIHLLAGGGRASQRDDVPSGRELLRDIKETGWPSN